MCDNKFSKDHADLAYISRPYSTVGKTKDKISYRVYRYSYLIVTLPWGPRRGGLPLRRTDSVTSRSHPLIGRKSSQSVICRWCRPVFVVCGNCFAIRQARLPSVSRYEEQVLCVFDRVGGAQSRRRRAGQSRLFIFALFCNMSSVPGKGGRGGLNREA